MSRKRTGHRTGYQPARFLRAGAPLANGPYYGETTVRARPGPAIGFSAFADLHIARPRELVDGVDKDLDGASLVDVSSRGLSAATNQPHIPDGIPRPRG